MSKFRQQIPILCKTSGLEMDSEVWIRKSKSQNAKTVLVIRLLINWIMGLLYPAPEKLRFLAVNKFSYIIAIIIIITICFRQIFYLPNLSKASPNTIEHTPKLPFQTSPANLPKYSPKPPKRHPKASPILEQENNNDVFLRGVVS